MMKKTFAFPIVFAAVLLMGQGCATSAPADVTFEIPAETETSTPPAKETPANPIEENATSTNTMQKEMNLAFPGVLPAEEVNKNVVIKTTVGDIVIQIDPEAGPNAASNFVYLVKEGFYDGTIFHRVIPGFMIQGGDPTGTGMGGPGYKFPDDKVSAPYSKGTVAMANAGPNTNGSQFFIMVEDYPLPPSYSIFGKVVEGQDVADAISKAGRDPSDRPHEEIKMIKVDFAEK